MARMEGRRNAVAGKTAAGKKAAGTKAAGKKSAGTRAAGKEGEELAVRHLEARGYRILARNYRCTVGEIDVVATQDEYLVFVEVKTRRGRTAYPPGLSVNGSKMAKLRELGSYYLSEHPHLNLQPRFDVIAVVLTAPRPIVEHFENAF